MARRMRAALSAESVLGHPAGDEVPQERVEAVERPGTLGHQVNRRLSESRRSTSEPTSGSTAASRSLREAAKAVARASSPSFLRALPEAREHPHPCRKLGRHVHHSPAGRRKPPRQMTTGPAGVLHRPTALGEPSRPALEGPKAGAVLREGSTLEELACGFVDRGDG